MLAQSPAVLKGSSGRIHAFESCIMYASRSFCQASAFNPIIAPHSLEARTLVTIDRDSALFFIKTVLMTGVTPEQKKVPKFYWNPSLYLVDVSYKL